MSSKWLLALTGSLALFFTHCDKLPVEKVLSNAEKKSVKIAISTPSHFDTIANYATVKVSAPDMMTMEQKLSISYNEISGIIHQIPSGYARKFEVFVYGYNNDLRYYGSAYADIFANDTVLVQIILRKPGGTAIISGYIEEFPNDSLYAPEKPHIEYVYIDTLDTAKSIITFHTEGCPFGDSLINYYWTFARTNTVDLDTFQYVFKGTTSFTDSFIGTGNYKVTVQGYRYQNPNVVSPVSEPLYFRILNGVLIDNLPNQDTIAPVIKLLGGDSIIISVNDSLYDPGATAYDNVDGDLTYKIIRSGYVNPSVTGAYRLSYSVSDRSGNTAIAMRIVLVLGNALDRIAPVITLKGSTTIYLNPGDTFKEPGYSAIDNIDGDITSNVTVRFIPDTSELYNRTFVYYSVSDKAGNFKSVYRTISKQTDNETITTPEKPYILGQEIINSKLQITIVTDTSLTSTGDPVFYTWNYSSLSDSSETKAATGDALSFACTKDGYYTVRVFATCSLHPKIKSAQSSQLLIYVKDMVASEISMDMLRLSVK